MIFLHYWKQFVAWVTEWWQTSRKASSVWRLTRLYTGLLLVVVVVLLLVLYELSLGQMERQQQTQFTTLIKQQTALEAQLDANEFMAQFQSQADSTRQYILGYQYQNQLIGRLSSTPDEMPICPNTSRFPIWSDKYNEIRLISGCSKSLNSGTLFIGVDDESLYQLKSQYVSASMIALLLALLLGVFTGFVFSLRVLKRINSFNDTALLVESGQLSARVDVAGNNDEYDHMAIHINTMLDQLQNSFETISGITDAIAHDLRTPLSHLRQNIESELHVKLQENQPCEALQSMLEQLDEILFTFSAMLELTRLQQQKEQKSQHFTTVDLQKIIEDAIDLIEPMSEEKQQTIRFTINHEYKLMGDATLLFRAIYNLLENASKYAGEQTVIHVLLTKQGFIISDNGPGISDEEKAKVFQRLYRVEKSRQIPGFGLGLTLVESVIHLHHGKIDLQDNHPGLRIEVEFN